MMPLSDTTGIKTNPITTKHSPGIVKRRRSHMGGSIRCRSDEGPDIDFCGTPAAYVCGQPSVTDHRRRLATPPQLRGAGCLDRSVRN